MIEVSFLFYIFTSQFEADLTKKDKQLNLLDEEKNKFLVEEGKYQQEEASNQKDRGKIKSEIAKIIPIFHNFKENCPDFPFHEVFEECLVTDPNSLTTENVLTALTVSMRCKNNELTKILAQFQKEEKRHQSTIDKLR